MAPLLIFFLMSLIFLVYFYGIYILLLKKYMFLPEFKTNLPKNLPTISIIICAHNEERVIEEKIKNTLALDYPKDKLRIIVVDDGSTDKTAELVKKAIKRNRNVSFLSIDERNGKAHALNFALKRCKTDFFVTTDANTTLNKECLKEAVKVFLSNAKIGCVTGRRLIPEPKNAVEAGEQKYWKMDSLIKLAQSNFSSVTGIIGEFSIYKTKILKELGGFNEVDVVAEDFESALMLIEHGHKVTFCSNCKASEPSPKTFTEIYERRARAVCWVLRTVFRHKNLLFNPKYKEYGMWLLPTQCLFFVLSPFAIAMTLLMLFLSLWSKQFYTTSAIILSALFIFLIIKKVENDNPFRDSIELNAKPESISSGILHLFIDQIAIVGGLFRLIFKTQKRIWKKLETTR